VFDLDDTLYMERDYVRSGFRHVAEAVASDLHPSNTIFDFLWGLFEQGVRGDTFDRLVAAFPSIPMTAEQLVACYRSHLPAIRLLDGAHDVIESLAAGGCRVGLLSDGPLASQDAKVKALGLEAVLSPVVLTSAWGHTFSKPHPRGYEQFPEHWRLEHERLVYVADNPEKDFVTPKRLGWRTIRLRMDGQLRSCLEASSNDHAPDDEIRSLEELTGRLP
jgi:putative hydrolase of the HAD superfamily